MISVIILTKNEEQTIERCLRSVSFADEIIIVDDFSTDNTVRLAEAFSVQLHKRKLNNDYSAQRNYALEKATGDYVMFLDADEEVSPELAEEIKKYVGKEDVQGYYLRRRDYFWNQAVTHGEVATVYNRGLLRIVKKGLGTWHGVVHEELTVTGKTKTLSQVINHYPHATVSEFLQSINHYSTLRAHELKLQGKDAGILSFTFWPFSKFVYTYFLKRGFKDGAAGFVYSFMMSFHSYLVRAKLYQYNHLESGSL